MQKCVPRFFILCILLVAWLGVVPPVMAQDGLPDVQTATPLPDGSLVHIVQPGESLMAISQAYGVSLADIHAMNNMDANSNVIYPGQHLILHPANPPTETPTITLTPPRPTRTPTRVVPTRTPLPTFTPAPSLTPSVTPNPVLASAKQAYQVSRVPLLYGMVVVCGLGLVWVIVNGFVRKQA